MKSESKIAMYSEVTRWWNASMFPALNPLRFRRRHNWMSTPCAVQYATRSSIIPLVISSVESSITKTSSLLFG